MFVVPSAPSLYYVSSLQHLACLRTWRPQPTVSPMSWPARGTPPRALCPTRWKPGATKGTTANTTAAHSPTAVPCLAYTVESTWLSTSRRTTKTMNVLVPGPWDKWQRQVRNISHTFSLVAYSQFPTKEHLRHIFCSEHPVFLLNTLHSNECEHLIMRVLLFWALRTTLHWVQVAFSSRKLSSFCY